MGFDHPLLECVGLRLKLRFLNRSHFTTLPPVSFESISNTRCLNHPDRYGVPDPPRQNQERIHQVLFNLLDNAFRFTPPGGRVWVRAVRGEGFCEEGGFGIAAMELENIARQCVEVAKLGVELAVVCGGGNFIRGADFAEFEASR